MLTYATTDCHPAPTATPDKVKPQRYSHTDPCGCVKYTLKKAVWCWVLPDKTGWRPFSRTVSASKIDNRVVSLATASLLVKRCGKESLVAKTTAEQTTPIKIVVMETTITENLAAFGFPAPSSLETLTLH